MSTKMSRKVRMSTKLLISAALLLCAGGRGIYGQRSHGLNLRSSSSEEAATATTLPTSTSPSELDADSFTLAPISSSTSISRSVHEHVSTSVSTSTGHGHSHSNSHSSPNTNVPVPVPVNIPVPVQVQVPEAPVQKQESQHLRPRPTTSSRFTTVELISPLPVIPITIDVSLEPENIISTTPPKSEPGQVLPVAEIYLAGVNDELTLLTNSSNSEILIDRKYVFNGSEFINIVLVCTAAYPIRWIYEGDGAPTRMYSSELRIFEDFHNSSSYEYFTTLVLMQERNNEHLTGTYTCEGAEYPNRGRVFYHLYFPGGYGFPTIRNRVIRPPKNDTHVSLPCMATNPKLPMTLYKIYPKEEAANLTSHGAVVYDAKSGFRMDLSQLERSYGTYYCSLNDADSFWKMDLVPSKEDEVMVSPTTLIVQQSNFANQTFSCAAKEPVELTFPQGLRHGTTSYVTDDASSEFPFVGVHTIDANLPLSALSKYFKINCVSKRTKRVLHAWEYSNIGSEHLAIKFDVAQRRILCCSASGLSTVQEIVKCETRTDCEIKKKCFENGRCEYPFPPRFVDAPAGCTAMEFLERVPTHAIKCSVGEYSKIVTVVETIERNDVLMIEEESTNPPLTDIILKIVVISQSANNDLRVKCSGSLYYFSTSLVFALENVDGSFEYIGRDLVDVSDPYEPVLTTRIGKQTRRVHCFAPLSGSSEWRNVSIPVVAIDPTTTTTRPSLSRGLSRGRTRLATAVAGTG